MTWSLENSTRTWNSDQSSIACLLRLCLEALTEEDLRNWGINGYSGTISQGDVLYIPTGWLVHEVCTADMTYGLRKSIFYPTVQGHKSYSEAMEQLRDLKGAVPSKMSEISKLWSANLAKSAPLG